VTAIENARSTLRSRRRFGRTGWWVMTSLCLVTLANVAHYLQLNPATYFAEQRDVYLRREVMLGLHVCGAMVALAVGPFQFVPRLRRGHARVHRTLGVTYLTAATVGGVGGLGMASTAYTGLVASLGFASLAVCWLACTWTGLAMILRGRVADHRRWMVRSFSLVFAGVTLRLVLGTYTAVEGSVPSWLSFHTVYMTTAWLCWVPNLLVALWITRSRPATSAHQRRDLGRARIWRPPLTDAMVFELASDGRITRVTPHLRPWLALSLFVLILAGRLIRHPGMLLRASGRGH
jgi:uncharacterized membrane protein